MTCDDCGRAMHYDEAHYPDDRGCDPWTLGCDCDNTVCPECCWECAEAPT